ncbi:MAG: M50 family metallopeptidase [Roseivirga sp.]|nr:M50 family metallopeptidase [Roseivirga sp.]
MKLSGAQKQLLILLVFLATAVILWNTIILYPVKIFVVMLHEMSHGLMAELFGGDIIEIQIDHRIGGYCKYTVPNSFIGRFMIASAGYLGSLLWGALILILAVKTDKDRYISLGIGIALLLLSWFVIKTGEPFGIIMTVGFGLFMLASFKLLSDTFHDYFLKFIGMVSCIYVVIDIKGDLIDRTGIGSDADSIAEMTGIPSLVVGIIWFFIASLVIYYTLKYAFRSLKK